MKLNIEPFTSITDWVVNAPSTVEESQVKKFIAGLNAKSLLFFFSKDDTVKTATKVFSSPIDVTNYDDLVFSLKSMKLGNQIYRKSTDFVYKIKINATDEYFIPAYDMFNDVTISIEDVTEITQIQITALHSVDDYVYFSEMVAVKEQFPLDLFIAVKETLENLITSEYGDGVLVGTVTASTGDSEISITNPPYLQDNTVITIDDGSNSESHIIKSSNGDNFTFGSLYDGISVVNNFTNANVYLSYPVFFGTDDINIRLPGIAVWGFTPEPILRGGKLEEVVDTYKTDDTFQSRQEGQIYRWGLQLDCEGRSNQNIANLTEIVRKWIAGEILWVNGRPHDVEWDGEPIEIRPPLGIDILPKVQYNAIVEVKEDINDRETLVKTTSIDVDINII